MITIKTFENHDNTRNGMIIVPLWSRWSADSVTIGGFEMWAGVMEEGSDPILSRTLGGEAERAGYRGRNHGSLDLYDEIEVDGVRYRIVRFDSAMTKLDRV